MTNQQEAGLFDNLPDPEGALSIGVRCLRPDQYDLSEFEPGRVIFATEEIRRIVGDLLEAHGAHDDPISGLFAGGGAGFQGVTRSPADRPRVVIRNLRQSTGEVIVAIDLTSLDQSRVFDLRRREVRDAFLGRYPRFRVGFDMLANEGVVAVQGDIPLERLTGLVRIPEGSDEAAIRDLLEHLVGGE